jgi:two-component system response regulator AtoC
VLETGTFVRVGMTQPIATDVRIIAATNKQPARIVAEGKFREDLYHRLNVFPIQMPPLRERGKDMEALAQHFLDELNELEGTRKRFSSSAIERLAEHSWPGNVRELRNYVQRAYILADDVIDGGAEPSQEAVAQDAEDVITVRVGTPLNEIEKRVTMATLQKCSGVKKRAAEILGISLKTLYNRLEVYAQKERAMQESARMEDVGN